MSIRTQNGRPRVGLAETVPFRRAFIERVHRLLDLGHKRLRAVRNLHVKEEPAITGHLVDCLRRIIEDRRSPAWMSQFAVHDDPPQSSAGAEGKQRRRVDIIFELTQRGVHPRFPIEAKRLNETKGVREYLGEDGLGCFLLSRYAPEACDAGMLAYVQEGAVDDWAKKVADQLEQDRTTHQLAPGTACWIAETFVGRPIMTFRTHHIRKKRSLAVYHTFMPCQRAPRRND